MITKFDYFYGGHVEMENMGFQGLRVDDRLESDEHLASVFDEARSIAQLMDQLNFDGHTLTCGDWTSNAVEDLGTLGHINRRGNAGYAPWNSTHPSRGCDAQSIADSGGAGLLYCFATD